MAQVGEFGGEHDRQRGFVELGALPERGAVGEEVLHPVPVGLLLPGEVAQQPGGVLDVTRREEGEPGFHRVAGPHQVVPAGVVGGVAPRDGQAGDDRAGVAAVLVDPQHRDRAAQRVGQVRRVAGLRRREHGGGGPVVPGLGESVAGGGDPGVQAGLGQGLRGGGVVGERERQQTGGVGEFTGQHHEPGAGVGERPRHRAVAVEVLPQVGRAEIADAGAGEPAGRGQAQVPAGALREQRAAVRGPRGVVRAAPIVLVGVGVRVPLQVAGQQRVHLRRGPGQFVADQQHIPRRVGHHLKDKLERVLRGAGVGDGRQRRVRIRRGHGVPAVGLDLDPPAVAGDDEPEVTDLRFTGGGPVHLRHDALPERGPHPGRAQRCGHRVLRRGREERAHRLHR